MPGRTPDPRSERSRKGKTDRKRLDTRRAMPVDRPDPPAGLAAALVTEWNAYFESPLAQATYGVTDFPALSRLWRMKHEVFDLQTHIDEEPIVRGSRGQPVPHPAIRVRNASLGMIQTLEDRFGLNPRSRMSLGLDFGRPQRTLDDLSANFPFEAEPDPRLAAVPDPDDEEG